MLHVHGKNPAKVFLHFILWLSIYMYVASLFVLVCTCTCTCMGDSDWIDKFGVVQTHRASSNNLEPQHCRATKVFLQIGSASTPWALYNLCMCFC